MAEEKPSPITAAKPPIASPLNAATPAAEGAATLKLKPVIRKPGALGASGGGAVAGVKIPVRPVVRQAADEAKTAPVAAAAAPASPVSAQPKALDQLKSVTQRLKGVTQEIPQQAILHRTGLIAQQALTEAQKQASKARTARISLSDAIGVAPVAEPAHPASAPAKPMKTIRIKRPVDLPPAGTPANAPASASAASAAEPPAAPEAAPAPAASAPTVTQRKTLKISRPGAGPKPTMKFGPKKPGVAAAAPAAAGTDGTGDVADIPDIPDMPAAGDLSAPAAAKSEVGGVPTFVGVISIIVQAAACVAMGALGYLLFQDTQIAQF